jgi:hypothetical protein
MSLPAFAESPTKEALADARRILEETCVSVRDLTTKIDAAEAALAQIVRNSRYAISEMETQRSALEKRVVYTLGFLSPIRRLPLELLREIFLWSFEGHPCSAWLLAAVCASWRRLALRTPLIWSKVSASNLVLRVFTGPLDSEAALLGCFCLQLTALFLSVLRDVENYIYFRHFMPRTVFDLVCLYRYVS